MIIKSNYLYMIDLVQVADVEIKTSPSCSYLH